jgi:hypothetical protein
MTVGQFAKIGVLFAIFVAAGCKSNSKPEVSFNDRKATAKPAQTTPTAVAVESTPENAPPLNAPPLPDTLAQRTAEYARIVQPAADARVAAPQSPSPVRWTEAKGTVRAAANTPTAIPAAGTAPMEPPLIASQADSAQLAAVTHSTKQNALNDVPAIVPESSDFPVTKVAADSLEAKLAKQVRDNPRDVAAQLDYELYGMLKDESSPQLASISMLPNEDRELVAALVDGVSNFRTSVRQDNNMLLSKKIRPILDMADRVRTQAELSVPVVALCTKVDGYGKYEPINPPQFTAGRVNPVIVYCEIANFASQQNDQQLWETKLRQEVTLYTETGMPVWHEKSREVNDQCRNRRHDFFLYDVVKLPANLSVGRYILKITIQDQTANRVREATVPVEMVAETDARLQ